MSIPRWNSSLKRENISLLKIAKSMLRNSKKTLNLNDLKKFVRDIKRRTSKSRDTSKMIFLLSILNGILS
jgi:DNA-directed RNA polymerase delta subunit